MVQWCEHSPPTNVAWVRFLNLMSYVVEFIVGSYPCSEFFFSSSPPGFFFSLLKNQHFLIPIQSGI